jgi:hypothetical protein
LRLLQVTSLSVQHAAQSPGFVDSTITMCFIPARHKNLQTVVLPVRFVSLPEGLYSKHPEKGITLPAVIVTVKDPDKEVSFPHQVATSMP